MKRVLLTIWMVLLTIYVLAQKENYGVIHIEQNDGVVCLYMDPHVYKTMSEEAKKELIKSNANKYAVKIVNVINNHTVELWRVYYIGAMLVDSWDMNSTDSNMEKMKTTNNPVRSIEHPWFFNISGSMSAINTVTINGYGRIGFFLMKGRWDMAVNGLVSCLKTSTTSDGDKTEYSYSLGCDTRVYFPIKSIKTSPFIGLGVSKLFDNEENESTIIPMSLGVSIKTKKGSIDITYQYEKTMSSVFVIGYTFMLK